MKLTKTKFYYLSSGVFEKQMIYVFQQIGYSLIKLNKVSAVNITSLTFPFALIVGLATRKINRESTPQRLHRLLEHSIISAQPTLLLSSRHTLERLKLLLANMCFSSIPLESQQRKVTGGGLADLHLLGFLQRNPTCAQGFHATNQEVQGCSVTVDQKLLATTVKSSLTFKVFVIKSQIRSSVSKIQRPLPFQLMRPLSSSF